MHAWIPAVLVIVAWPAAAYAQPCCTGGTTISPARLARHETALVGLSARTSYKLGDFDQEASFVSLRSGNTELTLEQDLLAAIRVTDQLQFSALFALVETYKAVQSMSEMGGGIGDITISGRWDFTDAMMVETLPGIAVSLGVLIPTGRPPERATNALATDSTGTGFAQATIALSVEDVYFNRLFVSLNGGLTKWFPRTEGDLEISRGLQFFVAGAVSWVLVSDLDVGAVIRYQAQGNNAFGGSELDGTSRRSTTISLVSALALDPIRIQAALSDVIPIGGLSRNESAALGLTLTGIWTF